MANRRFSDEERRLRKNAFQNKYYADHKIDPAYMKRMREIQAEKRKDPKIVANRKSYKSAWYAKRKNNPEYIAHNKNVVALYNKNNPGKSNKRKRLWAVKNPEKVSISNKAWRQANPEKERRRKIIWLEENKERCFTRKKAYLEKNKERYRIHCINRRASERASGKLSTDLTRKLMALQNKTCAYCPSNLTITGYHLDHYIPLSLGGPNTDDNIRLACPSCNLSKNDTHPLSWAGRWPKPKTEYPHFQMKDG